MAEIIWSARSLKDIDEMANYIAKDSLQYAQEQAKQFFIKTKILEKQPLAGRRVPEINISSVRQLLCGHYRIIYEIINQKKIGIITIHYQSRLLQNNSSGAKLLRKRKQK